MSTILPSPTVTQNTVAQNTVAQNTVAQNTVAQNTVAQNTAVEREDTQPDQPGARWLKIAKQTPPANGNGFYTKTTMQTAARKSEHGKHVSAEEYLRQYANHPDFVYEWNNGILDEKPVSTLAQLRMYLWFLQILSFYLEANRQAAAAVFEFLAEMQAGDKLVKRKPDLFIVRNDNPNPFQEEDESYTGICDLCVELLSTSNQANIDRDIKTKKAEYEAVGVHEYLILDLDADRLVFYRLNASGTYESVQPDADGIVRVESLPGFQFRWADLLVRPPMSVLADDAVYNRYVFPEYEMRKHRAERAEQLAEREAQNAKQARQLAEQEAQNAKQAKQLAEKYAAQLRALGIDPTTLP